MKHPIRFRPTLALLTAFTSACAGGPPPAPEPLPFHVALVPLSSIEVRNASESREGAPTNMLIQTDPALLSELLVESLERDAGFARVTLLEPSEALPENATEKQRNRMWIDQANEVGADLILVCDLSLSPVVYQNPNSRFLVNIPVWLLVGPIAWFIRDRTYYMDANLEGGFYAPQLIDPDFGELTDRMARVAAVSAHFGELDQNFISRAHGRLGRYALTIIIPPGFVAKQSDSFAAALSAATEEALCRGLASGVQSKASDIVRGDYLAPFYLDPQSLTLELQADGTFDMSGIVQLEPDQTVKEMNRLRVTYSDAQGRLLTTPSLELGFGAEEKAEGSRWTRYSFAARLTPPPDARLVRLEVQGGGRTVRRRTYTLVLPGMPEDIPLASTATGAPSLNSD